MPNKLSLIFFGTDEFAVIVLKALQTAGFEIRAVVTTPDEPAGRDKVLTPSAVKIVAQTLGLEILQPTKLRDAKLPPADIGILAVYGKIVPQSILEHFPYGILNIHPSILPKYRGPSPIKTAVLNGDEVTGISIIKLDAELDHGDLVAQKTVACEKDEKLEEFRDRLAHLSANFLIEVLPRYISGELKPRPQDHAQATFTKLFTKDDGRVDFEKDTALTIYNKFRALHDWPGIWTEYKSVRLNITDCKPTTEEFNQSQPGEIIYKAKNLYVICKDGNLQIIKLQPAGKREQTAVEFINGFQALLKKVE